MNQFLNIFQRYEKKYLITKEQYLLLREELKSYATVDSYGKSKICNIYFDTPSYQLIRTSLEKPCYKEKLRLRSYGTPVSSDSKVFVELKKKYKGVVYKRRIELPYDAATDYLYKGKPVAKPCQITGEIDWMLSFYDNISPAMYLSYDRIAMVGNEDQELRITFDSNILWREEKLMLNSGIWGNSLLEQGQRLMEIKLQGAMPIWLAQLLSRLLIFPTSFSKYGNAYLASQEIKTAAILKGVEICA